MQPKWLDCIVPFSCFFQHFRPLPSPLLHILCLLILNLFCASLFVIIFSRLYGEIICWICSNKRTSTGVAFGPCYCYTAGICYFLSICGYFIFHSCYRVTTAALILMLLVNRKGIRTVENFLSQSSVKVFCWGCGLRWINSGKEKNWK